MIVVAAGTAFILVQTSTSLANKATTVGQRSLQFVSSYADIIMVEEEWITDQNEVRILSLKVRVSPGSDGLDFNDTVVSINTKNASVDLEYSASSCFDSGETPGGSVGYWSNHTTGNGYFGVESIIEGSNYQEGYLQRGDVQRIIFELPDGIGADEEVHIKIIPASGGVTSKTYFSDPVIPSGKSQHTVCS
jgi:archaellin